MTRAKCAHCKWVFDVAAAPMPIKDWVRASMSACCPMCANHAGNFVADARDLTTEERAHKGLPLTEAEMPEQPNAEVA